MNFRPITTAINGLATPLAAISQNLRLLLDVAASIDRRLEEQNKMLEGVLTDATASGLSMIRTLEYKR